jgi:hypothetical protein
MDLILIHGAPGVGKLTTGRELARLTGFKLFHNHASIDLVRTVLLDNTAAFWDLVTAIRYSVVEAAARENVNLIHTNAYARRKDGSDPEHKEEVVLLCEAVERHGGRVCPVKLTCDLGVLRERIQREDRARLGKPASVDHLQDQLERYIFPAIPDRPGLEIDNTHMEALDTAKQIVTHYSLPWTR